MWGIPGTVFPGQGDVVPPGPLSCTMLQRFPVADRPGSRRLDMGRAGEGRRQPHPRCLWPQQPAAPSLTLGHQPALPDLPGSQRGSTERACQTRAEPPSRLRERSGLAEAGLLSLQPLRSPFTLTVTSVPACGLGSVLSRASLWEAAILSAPVWAPHPHSSFYPVSPETPEMHRTQPLLTSCYWDCRWETDLSPGDPNIPWSVLQGD